MSVQVHIDGTNVTSYALEGSVTRRLNRPSQARVRLPVQHAVGGAGSRLKITINSVLKFHGFVLTCSDEADENTGYTVYEAADPMEMWRWRPARDHTGPTPGNFITPSFFKRLKYAPLIMEEILLRSMDGSNPAVGEGPLFITIGYVEGSSSADVSGAPTNFPMTIAEVASLLTSTGVLDIVMTPIDSGGNMGQVSFYNGQYGTDRTASVSFDFATGAHNVRNVRRVQDMTNMCNKLWYNLGPKETINRYKANITGDDNYLDCACRDQSAVLARRAASQAAYGVRMDIQEFDVDVIRKENQSAVDCTKADPVRMIYRCQWQTEQWIRSVPKDLVHITPVRGVGINAFDIGDLVSVNAGSYLRGGFSGAQRIYEYTVGWDEDGVLEITELVTSPTQEGGF